MNRQIEKLLAGEYENHIMPFFWQHGESEEKLREYMGVIDDANCKAVCVESRPHPDYCGPKWWEDMDVILDEARKRNMKVWILDDSHFPTGIANGAMKDAPIEKHRQSVCSVKIELDGPARKETIDLTGVIPGDFKPAGMMEQYVLPMLIKDAPHFDDDHAIAVTGVSKSTGEVVYGKLTDANTAELMKPEGSVTVYVIGLSRNLGPHRDFINMLDPESCRVLIDAVYEKHYEHYKDDFGKTIAGFFSDEPELGNGHLYFYDNLLGTDQDLPFSENLPAELEKVLGENWANRLYLLWDNDHNKTEEEKAETSFVRYSYMDIITNLVKDSFSYQLGNWCREHGVLYIGHMIEDSNAHARTGSSLGHYFRGLEGQDMSGIDDIGGQVLPQGEEEPSVGVMGANRDGEFYHYELANLAASAAAIEPNKHGNAMCEIFGNYGWAEGTRLEKYLADHFMVNGINQFVPHAFSPAEFPDTDCPPHFYANGHNPEYRAFGQIMAYMNRVSTLISNGRRCSQVAVLYHGDSEWAGEAELTQKAVRALMEHQIVVDTIPGDVFARRDFYKTEINEGFKVNKQTYEVFVIPKVQAITEAVASGISELTANGVAVYAIGSLPERICDVTDDSIAKTLLNGLKDVKVTTLGDLVSEVTGIIAPEMKLEPVNTYIRALHYIGESDLYYFVNEGKEPYTGTISLHNKEAGEAVKTAFFYDAYLNRTVPVSADNGKITVTMLPLHSYIIVAGECNTDSESAQIDYTRGKWIYEGSAGVCEITKAKRSVCEGINYPSFSGEKEVAIPDSLAEEQPEFSGYVKYETEFEAGREGKASLLVEDAYEAVEVFVNEKSLGIQIVPPFAFDLSSALTAGTNKLRIEVATTLERYCYGLTKDDIRSAWRGVKPPVCGSGITGKVKLWIE